MCFIIGSVHINSSILIENDFLFYFCFLRSTKNKQKAEKKKKISELPRTIPKVHQDFAKAKKK